MDTAILGNFNQLIAYIIPGFIGLYEFSNRFPSLQSLFNEQPTLGSFLYIAFLSLAFGLLVSPVRWLVIDELLMRNIGGLKTTNVKLFKLKGNLDEYKAIIENYYSYYKFYSNTLIIGAPAFLSAAVRLKWVSLPLLSWSLLSLLFVLLAFAYGYCAYVSLDTYIKKAKEILPN